MSGEVRALRGVVDGFGFRSTRSSCEAAQALGTQAVPILLAHLRSRDVAYVYGTAPAAKPAAAAEFAAAGSAVDAAFATAQNESNQGSQLHVRSILSCLRFIDASNGIHGRGLDER